MNWLGFIGLMREIYGPGLPDLDRIQRQGLLAVKIGQTFALRADFLDETTCRHLAQLYRRNISLPAENFHQLLAANTGIAWRERFQDIDAAPLATASVGQVHKGTLRDGQRVVVKLIKGDFAKRFVRDVRSVKRLTDVAIFFYPKLAKVADPAGILAHIEEYTLAELDLRNEVANGEILRGIRDKSQGRYDLSHLVFPKVYQELSGAKVLVSEFIDGQTFDELLERGQLPYGELLKLFSIHGFFMFGAGTFHGDIHPGNVILKGGDLYFIDTGAISRVGDRIRTGLFRFFESLAWDDYPRCAHWINQMAESGLAGTAYDAYQEKFLDLYKDFSGTTVSQVSLTKMMMDTIKLAVNAGMVFEKGMYPIIKSLMYLDGMVLRCKPDAVLARDMRGFIGDFKKALDGGA